ncbi:MAG: peptidase M23 [Candidatus Peregrinibacteria bacterium GW2011_GWE2_39_6]|nr:MAG: peptidase M23 [Candidatus Peregrinibacteria bacterium GW2011_GWF2_39_17]KKR24384.1 MAG: peptidase M23 [Candidatus Peregrinibacteria bacterium GW2011_GWE2_39_6]
MLAQGTYAPSLANDSSNTDELSNDNPDTSNLDPDALRNAYLLIKLRDYLQSAQNNYQSLQDKIDETRTTIDQNRYKISDLQSQVNHLEGLVGESENKIRNVETQIAVKETDIRKSLEAVNFNTLEQEHQRDILKSYLRLLYLEKNLYYDNSNNLNGFKILLQPETISSVLQQNTYLGMLENQAETLMDHFLTLDHQIKRNNYELNIKHEQLTDLRDQLEGEHRNLQAQFEGKQNLLNETKGNDQIYRDLFASYLAAQEAVTNEIASFYDNINLLDERFSILSQTLTAADLQTIQTIRDETEADFSTNEAADFLKLDWPVSPASGLTAYFDDASYITAFGVAHHALDIRANHGSVIYAPSDGFAFKVYDAAALSDSKAKLGYGYLVLAHQKGAMTVYGHVSAILVKEGDFVRRGQIVALSGGTPGTPGAGVRTTGPHLHFEVYQNGVLVDPLEYLALAEVPLDYLPEKYQKILQQQLEQDLADQGVTEADLQNLQNTPNQQRFEESIQQTLENNSANDSSFEER